MPEYTAILVMALAGVVKGFSGLGFALVSVPLLAFIWEDPKKIIAFITVCSLVQTSVMLKWAIPRVPWKTFHPMAAGMLPGIILGIYLVKVISGDFLLGILGGSLLLISFWKLTNWLPMPSEERELPTIVTVIFGAVSGAIGALTCANGPPLILYSSLRAWPAEKIKAFVQPIFIWAGFWQLLGYLYIGTVTVDLLKLAALSSVPMLVSTLLGLRYADDINKTTFERAFYFLVLLLGGALIYKSLFD